MKTSEYKLVKYEPDEGKVFDWKEPREIKDEEGKVTGYNHLYASILFLGKYDSIDNYIEVDAPHE